MTKISEKGIEKAAEAILLARKTGVELEARAAITAYLDAVATEPPASDPAPVGWRMVPVELTEDMRRATWFSQYRSCGASEEDAEKLAETPVRDEGQRRHDRDAYAAMLAAAPEPPVSAEPTQQQLDAAWARVAPLVGCDPTSAADPVPSGWRDISTAPTGRAGTCCAAPASRCNAPGPTGRGSCARTSTPGSRGRRRATPSCRTCAGDGRA